MFPNNSFFKIEFNKFLIRIVDIEDINDYYDICKSIDTCKYLTFKPFKCIKEAKNTVENMIRAYLNGDCLNYSIYSKIYKKVIGSISLTFNVNNNQAEIGYLLNHDYFNKKVMSTILPEFIKKSFEFYNLNSIIANVNINNIYSIKLLEKNNFKLYKKDNNILTYILDK